MRDLVFNLVFASMMVSPPAWAAAIPEQFDPVQFEKRFHKADKDKKGKLSRKEAYAEFPRMPEFFDEIDTNRDGFITLEEVNKTMERRVNAAMDSSKSSGRYSVEAGKQAAPIAGANAGQDPLFTGASADPRFTSEAEERRYRRMQFYESIEDDKSKAIDRGESVPPSPFDVPSSPILLKPF